MTRRGGYLDCVPGSDVLLAFDREEHVRLSPASRLRYKRFRVFARGIMNIENALYPAAGTVADLIAAQPSGALVMVNLLKFRLKAVYPDGRPTELSGQQAYMLYGAPMQRIVAQGGGRLVFSGQVRSLVIGNVDELWDMVALMEYPSAAEFARIVASPEVAEIGIHRAAGLAGQLLIATSPAPPPVQ
jgi:uncharacterized protein (DUF1330 family)